MKTLYFDCGMGAAGDMLAAALLELLPDPQAFLERFNALGIPGVAASVGKETRCGIGGTRFHVTVHDQEEDGHHHHHSGMTDVAEILSELPLPEKIKGDVQAVYRLIAEAESQVHQVPVTEVHFHEVGALDAIADVTAVCMLMDALKPEQVIASPVHVGSGSVRCAHGDLPVPAPATAYLLRDIPIYGGSVQGELCTPTGAALLKHFVMRFGDMPVMRLERVGYGLGKKEFPRANCLRAMWGEAEQETEDVVELCCNVDDMTGEAMGFALEQLLSAGALDAFTVPVNMKKSRPGLLLWVICREADREKLLPLIFRHTTTLGIRQHDCRRYTLSRSICEVDTPWGTVRRKDSAGYGVHRWKYEYEDLAAIAREQGVSLTEVQEYLKEHT